MPKKSMPKAVDKKISDRQIFGGMDQPGVILDEEIAALRASASKMLAHAEEVSDPLDAIKALSACGTQIVRIANLLRLQANLAGSVDDVTTRAAIEAIAKLAEEWK